METLFVGLDGAVEGEKFLIPIERRGKHSVALCITLAANLLSFGVRLCDEDADFSISTRLDLLGALIANGTKLRSLALALGLHALINGLAVLLRQVGSPDPQVCDCS